MTDSTLDITGGKHFSAVIGSDMPSDRGGVRLRQCLERITGLAARALNCTAAIYVLDGEHVRHVAQTGTFTAVDEAGSTFCRRVSRSMEFLVFENEKIGVPLKTATGETLGVLCLWGAGQDACRAEKQQTLADLAALAVCQIEAGMAGQGVDALQESRQRATHFMEHLPGLAFLKDMEHRYLYVNDRCLEMFAEQIAGWIGHTDDEIWPQETAAAFRGTDNLVIQTGQPQQAVDLFTLPDGPRAMLSTKFPIRDSRGVVCMIGGISLDITEQKRAELALRETENALRESREQMDNIMSSLDDVVWSANAQTHEVTYCNGAAETVYGCSRDEFLNNADFRKQVVHPEDLSKRTDEAREFYQTGRGNFEYRIVRPDGEVRWLNERCRVIRNAGGEAVRIDGVTTDITERKRVEEALQNAERNYRSIFENAVEGIFQTNSDGQYLRANPALARIYGYTSAEELMACVRTTATDLYVDTERRDAFIRHLEAHDTVANFEAQVYRRNGTVMWISENARAVRDPDGTLIYYEGTVEDISERKVMEAEQEQLLAEALERAERDPLTALLNHRAFHKRLEEEADRAQRRGDPLTIAVMDLDNFKFFNDSYGHSVGDDVLRQVAGALANGCRSYDLLARFGGDEFAVLMPGVGPADAAAAANRLKKQVQEIGYRPPGYDTVIPLGLSVGVATFPQDGPSRLDALEIADSRLLRAKFGEGDLQAEVVRATLTRSLEGFSMLDALVTAVDNKDRYTRRHSEDVMLYSAQIARELGLDESLLQTIQTAALLHDVGKIGVPDRVLRKPGRLSDDELVAVRRHPEMGAVIVGAVPGLSDTLDAVRHHHESWDGTGYPLGLRGEETPLTARIMAVADAFSAMTTDRPYRKGMRTDQAMAVLHKGAGAQWDPRCVAAFTPHVKPESEPFEASELVEA